MILRKPSSHRTRYSSRFWISMTCTRCSIMFRSNTQFRAHIPHRRLLISVPVYIIRESALLSSTLSRGTKCKTLLERRVWVSLATFFCCLRFLMGNGSRQHRREHGLIYIPAGARIWNVVCTCVLRHSEQHCFQSDGVHLFHFCM